MPGAKAPGGGAHHNERRRHCKPLGAPRHSPRNFRLTSFRRHEIRCRLRENHSNAGKMQIECREYSALLKYIIGYYDN
jgi:hypothetical protein